MGVGGVGICEWVVGGGRPLRWAWAGEYVHVHVCVWCWSLHEAPAQDGRCWVVLRASVSAVHAPGSCDVAGLLHHTH